MKRDAALLEGSVNWNYRRQSADRAVRYRAGVRDVDNHIVVRPVTELGAVKSRIEAALIRNGRLDAEHISVEVRGDSQRRPAIVDRA